MHQLLRNTFTMSIFIPPIAPVKTYKPFKNPKAAPVKRNHNGMCWFPGCSDKHINKPMELIKHLEAKKHRLIRAKWDKNAKYCDGHWWTVAANNRLRAERAHVNWANTGAFYHSPIGDYTPKGLRVDKSVYKYVHSDGKKKKGMSEYKTNDVVVVDEENEEIHADEDVIDEDYSEMLDQFMGEVDENGEVEEEKLEMHDEMKNEE